MSSSLCCSFTSPLPHPHLYSRDLTSLPPSFSSTSFPFFFPSSSSSLLSLSLSLSFLPSLSPTPFSLPCSLMLSPPRFTVSYVSFTLSLKLNDFGLDIYFVQVVPSILAVPARLCCVILLEYFGRKWTLNLTLFLLTFTCLFLLFLPQGTV